MADKKPPQSAEELLKWYAEGERDFQDALLFRANLARAKLVFANLSGANLERAKLIGANLAGAQFIQANLARTNLERTKLIEANLERANLERASLVGAVVEGANLAGVNLERANLAGAKLALVNFAGANLAGANLVGANLAGTNLIEVNLERANVERANLVGAIAERANLAFANLAFANLEGANLEGASIIEANLERANLERAKLVGAKLVGAHLEGARLEGTNLEGALVEGANLEGANLEGANLVRTNLEDAAFWNALLCGADLTEAILRNARLDYACLRGDSLKSNGLARTLFDAKELTQTQLDSAIGNEYTTIPDGFVRPASWKEDNRVKGSDEDGDRSLLILQFKHDAEPKTVQALSREMATWTEHFANLASVARCDSTAPIARIYSGSLVLEVIMAAAAMINALAAVESAGVAVRIFQRDRERYLTRDELVETIRQEIQKELGEDLSRYGRLETLVEIVIALLDFEQKGGVILLEASEQMLNEHPELRERLERIAAARQRLQRQ